MELTWYGLSCFRLTERGQATVVTDPYGKVGLPELKLKADILTISHDADGHNNAKSVSGVQHALTGPGEYEIGGVFVTGITTSNGNGKNVSFAYEYDGLTVAHLGDISKIPTQSQLDALGQVDILLLPVGGGGTINGSQAAELVSMVEPNIVVPMHYKLPKLKIELEEVERFLKEMGVNEPEIEETLKIKRSSLPEETQIVLLTPKI